MERKFYAEALFAQSACNAKGVIYSLEKVIKEICKEPATTSPHPVLVLFVDKLADMCDARENLVGDVLTLSQSDSLDLAEMLCLAKEQLLRHGSLDTPTFNYHPIIQFFVRALYKSLHLDEGTILYREAYEACEKETSKEFA